MAPALARLDCDYLDMEMVRTGVAEERMQIAAGVEDGELVVMAVFAMGQVVVGDDIQRMLEVQALVGDLTPDREAAMVDWAEQVARAEDCAGLMFRGRPGWARRMSQHGFRVANIVMCKEF